MSPPTKRVALGDIQNRYLNRANIASAMKGPLVKPLIKAPKEQEAKKEEAKKEGADLVYITDDSCTVQQIRQMELQILKAIDYNLSRPLPIHFLRRYSKAANAEEQHYTMAKYFIELAILDYGLASFRPSQIAAASLFLSLNLLDGVLPDRKGFNDRLWSQDLRFYSRYSAAHLRPLARQIAKLAKDAPQAKLRAIYNKYQGSRFQGIALRKELSGPLVDSIIGQGLGEETTFGLV